LLNLGRAIFRVGTDLYTDDIKIPQKYAQKSLALYQELQDEKGIAKANSALAFVYRISDKFEEANSLLTSSLAYYRKSGKKLLEANCLELLGSLYQIEIRDHTKAETYYTQALTIREAIDDTYGLARSFENFGDYYYDFFNVRFEDFYRKSETLYAQMGDKTALAWISYKTAQGYMLLLRVPESKRILEEALEQFTHLNNDKGRATVLTRLGSILMFIGDFDLAITYHNQCIDVSKNFGFLIAPELYAKHNLAWIFRLQGDYQKARNLFEFVKNNMPKIGYRWNLAQPIHDLGEVFRHQGRYREALDQYNEALDHTKNYQKVLLIFFQDILSCYYSILIGTQKFPDIDLTPYINVLRSVEVEVKSLKSIQRAAEAIYLKNSPRLKDHYKAQEILENIVASQILPNAMIGFGSELTLLDILLNEFKVSGEEVVFQEIQNLLVTIQKQATALKSNPLIVDINIIQAKLAQIKGNFDESNQILQKAWELVKKFNIKGKKELVQFELDQLEENFKTYNQWVEQNVAMKDRASKLEISEYITKAKDEILRS
jgi:tetratricopeptide (TPR) repeat protein